MNTSNPKYIDPDRVEYPEIVKHYNDAISGVVHCHSASTSHFERELQNGSDKFTTQTLIVADHGFAHVAIEKDKHDRPGSRALIRFVAFKPENYRTGSQLLEHAEQWARDHGAPYIAAFYQDFTYGFYHSPSACLSDRIGHIQALLQMRGYKIKHGEVFLDIDNYRINPPDALNSRFSEIVERKDTSSSRRSFTIRIADGEIFSGRCDVTSRESFGGFPEEADRLFFSWVGVDEPYQRQGLGRYLVRRALEIGREDGYKHASISTALNNHRAYVLYSTEGFRVVDWTYGWKKPL